ncbi:MAG: hypothetical protein V1691_00445 [Chloroflexota bacterium]
MSGLAVAYQIAERLRQEPYRLLNNDCLTKSARFKRACRELGIPARAVACIGLARARLFGRWLTLPVIHGWGEVDGQRIETSRPLGSSGLWGIVPMNIRPLVAIWF